MSCRYLEDVLPRQDNSKTILRCLEDILCRLGCLYIHIQGLTASKTTMCVGSESIILLNYENNIFMTKIDKELWDPKCAVQGRISCMPRLTYYRPLFPFYTPRKIVH